MDVGEVAEIKGVGGGVSRLIRVWKSVEKVATELDWRSRIGILHFSRVAGILPG